MHDKLSRPVGGKLRRLQLKHVQNCMKTKDELGMAGKQKTPQVGSKKHVYITIVHLLNG